MNYAALESAKRWQELGLFNDSEWVWVSCSIVPNCFFTAERVKFLNLKKIQPLLTGNDFIYGPAPMKTEMENYLNGIGFLAQFADDNPEAREKAINWYLDQTHSQ